MAEGSYDVLVIGGGQAGIPLATALAKQGKRVALAERKFLGGSCVNFGCTPTKAVIASARVAHLARRGAEFGIAIPNVTVDFPAVLRGARAILQESRDSLEQAFQGDGAPTLLRGHARLDGRAADGFRVRIGEDRSVIARDVVLDTGTRASIPKIAGLDGGVPYLTADDWLYHEALPAHVILLGGGYVGLEMAQFYRRMGSRVTVVDHSERIAAREDTDVSAALQQILQAEGIEFRLSAKVTAVERATDGGVSVKTEDAAGAGDTLQGSHLFVATGRMPNTGDLGLDTVGVATDNQGNVTVDRHLRSSVDGIWAAGDIRGGPLFTHTSWDDHRVLLSAMTGDGSHTTDRVVPYAIFTDPQLGRVGVTEAEARRSGKPIRIGRFELLHNGRARESRETAGFIKVVVDAESDRLLGAAVLAAEGGELVHIYVTLMNAGSPSRCIRDAVFIHPTLSEAVQSAVEAVG